MAVAGPDLVQMPVRLTKDVVRRLAGVPLFPQVEAVFEVADDRLQAVCRLWDSTWRQSKSISDMHR